MVAMRAKFRVCSVNHLEPSFPGEKRVEVKLEPTREKDGGRWSKWIKSGEFSMMVTDPAAIDQFAPCREFYIDFTVAG